MKVLVGIIIGIAIVIGAVFAIKAYNHHKWETEHEKYITIGNYDIALEWNNGPEIATRKNEDIRTTIQNLLK